MEIVIATEQEFFLLKLKGWSTLWCYVLYLSQLKFSIWFRFCRSRWFLDYRCQQSTFHEIRCPLSYKIYFMYPCWHVWIGHVFWSGWITLRKVVTAYNWLPTTRNPDVYNFILLRTMIQQLLMDLTTTKKYTLLKYTF